MNMLKLLLAAVLLVAVAQAQVTGACGHAQLPVGFLGYGVNPVLLDNPLAYTQPIVPMTYQKTDSEWYYAENKTMTCFPDQAMSPMDLDANLADMQLSMVDSYTSYSKNISEGLHVSVNFNVPKTNISVGGQFGYLHDTYKVFTRDEIDYFSQFLRYVEYYMVGIDLNQAKPSPYLMMALEGLPFKNEPAECIASPECVSKYCSVLETYGTFYVSKVVMGGSINVTASFNKTYETKYGASKTQIQADLTIKYLGQQVGMIGGSYNTTWAKIDNTFKEAMHNFTGVVGGDQAAFASGGYPAWMQTLPVEPEMIIWKSELTPIYHLIDLSTNDNLKRYDTMRATSLQYFNSGGVAPCNF